MKLTILALTNMSAIFGKTEYATFQAMVPVPAGSPEGTQPAIVDIGISHNLLARTGINIDQIDELVDSVVETVDYFDTVANQTTNVEERVQALVDGTSTGTIALISAISGKIHKSQAFINSSKDFSATVAAKTRIEKEEKNRQLQIQRSQERLRLRALAGAPRLDEVLANENLEPDFGGKAPATGQDDSNKQSSGTGKGGKQTQPGA